jgi:hypothetical protein
MVLDLRQRRSRKFLEIRREPFRISNDWGELGEYLDILKRSIARLNEHGHAG